MVPRYCRVKVKYVMVKVWYMSYGGMGLAKGPASSEFNIKVEGKDRSAGSQSMIIREEYRNVSKLH